METVHHACCAYVDFLCFRVGLDLASAPLDEALERLPLPLAGEPMSASDWCDFLFWIRRSADGPGLSASTAVHYDQAFRWWGKAHKGRLEDGANAFSQLALASRKAALATFGRGRSNVRHALTLDHIHRILQELDHSLPRDIATGFALTLGMACAARSLDICSLLVRDASVTVTSLNVGSESVISSAGPSVSQVSDVRGEADRQLTVTVRNHKVTSAKGSARLAVFQWRVGGELNAFTWWERLMESQDAFIVSHENGSWERVTQEHFAVRPDTLDKPLVLGTKGTHWKSSPVSGGL